MKQTFMVNLYKWLLLAYLAILPIAETIALRNLMMLMLLLLLLLLLLAWGLVERRQAGTDGPVLRWLPVPLLLWAAYLLLFPTWAPEPDVALANLKGQWGLSLLAWGIGLGAVLVLGRRGPGLWALGLASAFGVMLHLAMVLMVWMGVFGPDVPPELPVSQMWESLHDILSGRNGAHWHLRSFPWGFRGFDPMHGNLGYTASQAIALFLCCYFMAIGNRWANRAWQAIAAILVCFFSIIVANSRGAVIYSLLLVPMVGLLYLFFVRGHTGPAGGHRKELPGSRFWWMLPALSLVLAGLIAQALQRDSRWHTLWDSAKIGFMIADPVDFQCNGLSAQDERAIRQAYRDRSPEYVDGLLERLSGDGIRIVLMRAGWRLAQEHPLGLDGSRHSYKKLLAERCGHPPAFEFAHSHQAWFDTSLALGWAGMSLFAILLGYFVVAGLLGLGKERGCYWALALVSVGLFWMLRGFLDAVYREHYLQMQALLLGYLWGRMKLDQRESAHD